MIVENTDILIIGSGIAGLTIALKTANKLPNAKICIVTKSDENESNTKYAQGGIAVVMNKISDSYSKHIKDTLIAGDNLNDRTVVEMVIKKGPSSIKDIIKWGAKFDKTKNGEYDLGKEGGHSENRIIHHKDITGFEIERALLENIKNKKNIVFYTSNFALDLIISKKNKKCCGAIVFDENKNKLKSIYATFTVIASGGAGQLYYITTNPEIATGDGIAMAYRAGAKISDIEFIQFHPTALYQPEISPSFLISEAVRGFGAYLINVKGKRFMCDYDKRKELAPRDIVSRAIYSEMKKTKSNYVFLDCRHLNLKKFINHFPNIYNKLIELNIDITKDLIPVAPAAHYICGGINVNLQGESSVLNLYACGECARTGLHGANRLASNSLLEAVVYANNIYTDIVKKFNKNNINNLPQCLEITRYSNLKTKLNQIKKNKLLTLKNKLRMTMNNYLGIIKDEEGLKKAKKIILAIENEFLNEFENNFNPRVYELKNLITLAKLITDASIKRKENKGVFFKQ